MIFAFSTKILLGLIILFPPLIVILYSTKMLPSLINNRLKDIFLIKNFTTAFTWSFVTTALPVVYFSQANLNLSVLIVFSFVFFKVFLNNITFDIRDIEGDSKKGIDTLPVKLGVSKTKALLTFLNLCSFLIIIIPTFFQILPPKAYTISLIVVYTQFYIFFLDRTTAPFLYDLIADGEWIVMAILAIVGHL